MDINSAWNAEDELKLIDREMIGYKSTSKCGVARDQTRRQAMDARFMATALLAVCIASAVVPGRAQEFTKDPVGFAPGARNLIDPIGNARDENGNLIRNSIDDIDTGQGWSCGVGSTAFGNLVSVVINGNGNTVDIEATQVNTGDITAVADLGDGVLAGC